MQDKTAMHRMERMGGPPDLPTAFSRFVVERLGGRSLDDQHAAESAEGEFPDLGCYRDLVLFEMKHLETDQHDRVNEVLNEKIDPEERPLFFGRRPAHLVMDSISNAGEVNAAIFTKLSRSIEGILRKSNRQFTSYRSRHPRKNKINICVLLNSRLMEYTPEVVLRAIHSKMGGHQSGGPRFGEIDAVLYISEKHFVRLPDGRYAHPIATYEGFGAVMNEWKAPVINHIVNLWSNFRTGGDPVARDGFADMGTVEDISDRMSRSDMWLLEYARNPYLSGLTTEQLHVHFWRLMALNSLSFVKGSWQKPTDEETREVLRRFQHAIAETNRRGVDMRELDFKLLNDAQRVIVLAGLPMELANILQGQGGSH